MTEQTVTGPDDPAMTAHQFEVLCTLMSAEPFLLSPDDDAVIVAWANAEAQRHGFGSWVEAFHGHQSTDWTASAGAGPAEYLVGPRYAVADVRVGAGPSCVIEVGGNASGWDRKHATVQLAAVLAGPIRRRETRDGRWDAACDSCGRASRPYVRRNEPHLWTWAYSHWCVPEKIEGAHR